MPNFKITKKEVHTITFTAEIEAIDKKDAETQIEANGGASVGWKATGGGNSINISIKKLKEKKDRDI